MLPDEIAMSLTNVRDRVVQTQASKIAPADRIFTKSPAFSGDFEARCDRRHTWHIGCVLTGIAAETPNSVAALGTHASRVAIDAPEDVMNLLTTRLRGLLRKDSGQDLLEYALLVALVALVAVGAVTLTGGSVNDIFTNISGELATAAGAGGAP